MSLLHVSSYLIVFVVGVAFGKYVKFLDFQGTNSKNDSCHQDD